MAQAQSQLNWEVLNRFPLLSKEAFLALSVEVGPNVDGIETRLTQVEFRNKVKHLDRPTAKHQDSSSAWDEKSSRYDAERLLSDKAEIIARTDLGPAACMWSLTKATNETVFSEAGTCTESPQIPVVLGEAYELRAVRTGDLQSVSVSVKPRRHLIVALGDSFASGEGNPDYPAVFRRFKNQPPHDWAVNKRYAVAGLKIKSAQWLDTDCHRSLLSWPALYALRRALASQDTVVQFASFACSGAEVIDGFLLPQRNPPGRIGVKLGGDNTHLRVSQQKALAELLCYGQPTRQRETTLDQSLYQYLNKYGDRVAKIETTQCAPRTQPDEVLVQFGGNDTLFSGVVNYVFQPKPIKYKAPVGWFLNSRVNAGLYKALSPVPPDKALAYVDKLPELYTLLQRGLSDMNIEGARVRLVMYPDPVTSAAPEADQAAELKACDGRTRDANKPMQSLIAEALGIAKHDGALSGANTQRLLEVRDTYIKQLRAKQKDPATTPNGWLLTDSQTAINGFDLCAGSLECERLGEECPNADRVRWHYFPRNDKTNVSAPNSWPWEQISDFVPYDLERKRGIRYANDALLTSVRLDEAGSRVRLDWVAGIAHPTAAVHARIAALLASSPLDKTDMR
jgi:hypothetical protein